MNFDRSKLNVPSLWKALEYTSRSETLQLPAWFKGVGAGTVEKVREQLASRTLDDVGPEREILVSQALVAWRERVVEALKADY